MSRTKKNIFTNVDWWLIGLYFMLVLMGWLNIYATLYNEEHSNIFDFTQSYGKQLIWIGTSVILALIIFLVDSRLFETFAYFLYSIGMLLLVAVLIFGTEIKGAKSWFALGGFRFQPSETAKYVTALAVAFYLSRPGIKIGNAKPKLMMLAMIALPGLLILIQPDAGSTLVYLAFIFVLYREGMSGNIMIIGLIMVMLFIVTLFAKQTSIDVPILDYALNGKYVLIIILAVICGALYLLLHRFSKGIWKLIVLGFIIMVGTVLSVDYIFDNIFSDRHRNRVNELVGIISDPRGTGYNQHQSKIAIGSGGFWGKGYLEGTQTKYDFVPEQSTDFIFCTVGEEWGFIGSFFVIVMFLTLIGRLIFVAERQRSKFARIYGYSVASILFVHFMINIGMTIGLAPVIGIPLPFFSYGGSSLWSFTILLFTFIKLDSDRKHVLS
ncbi:rod shape-determining protein RodA [bacterium SCSIO 12643]|nr:rod shape-determining protein RodA [bacterium SCSIO 12643]